MAPHTVGQQLRHRLDVGHGRGAGAQQHLGALGPGGGVIGAIPTGLGLGDELEPVGEHLGRRELPGHVGVVQMAVGIDEAGQEDRRCPGPRVGLGVAGAKSRQRPTAAMRLPEIRTAPSGMAGRDTGRMTRARGGDGSAERERSAVGGAVIEVQRTRLISHHQSGSSPFPGGCVCRGKLPCACGPCTCCAACESAARSSWRRGRWPRRDPPRHPRRTGPGRAPTAASRRKTAAQALWSVVLQRHARIDRKAVQVLQLGNAADDVVFDRFGQSHIMSREDQVHADRMQRLWHKSERNCDARERGRSLTLLLPAGVRPSSGAAAPGSVSTVLSEPLGRPLGGRRCARGRAHSGSSVELHRGAAGVRQSSGI